MDDETVEEDEDETQSLVTSTPKKGKAAEYRSDLMLHENLTHKNEKSLTFIRCVDGAFPGLESIKPVQSCTGEQLSNQS